MKRKFALLMTIIMLLLCVFVTTGCDAFFSSCNDSLSDLEILANGSPTGKELDYNHNYIFYGEYPQTIKDESVTVDVSAENKDERGYFLGSDGEYYKQVYATPKSSNYKFSNDEKIISGKEYFFKVERITWRIRDNDWDEKFVTCDVVLDVGKYGKSTNNYNNSDIRKELNETFFLTAFRGWKSTNIIKDCVRNNLVNSGDETNPYICNDTYDRFFLQSFIETESIMFDHPDQRVMATDYARAVGVEINEDPDNYGYGTYMLRTPSPTDVRNIKIIDYNGNRGEIYINYKCGIVPGFVTTI